jgi:TRAP-type C4-dicarboxylate transport system substrate-binding protein
MAHLRTLAASAAVTLSLGAFSLGAAPAMAEDWNMPTPYPDATFHTQNIRQFAEDVDKATNGELKIIVHSAGSLIKHPEIKNSVRSGTVPIGEFFLSRLANEDPVFAVDSLPFLATSYEDAAKLWAASRPKVEEKLAEQRLKVLYAVPWPPQGLYTKGAVDGPDDLKGVKMRAYNPSLERLAQLLGAVPTQVEVPDIPQAFATGVVQAMITSPSTGANSKAWDFLDHYYDTRAWLPKNIVVVNARAFDALSADVQKAVMDAAAAAEARGLEMSMSETDAKTKILADNGITVGAPSGELKEAFAKAGATMAEEWAKSAGDDGKAILDAFNK